MTSLNAPADGGLTNPPPNRLDLAAEQEILAAILYDNTCLRPLRGGHGQGGPSLDWTQFGDRGLRDIAKAMWHLDADKKPVTVGTVAGLLGAGNDPRLRSQIQRIDDAAVSRALDALPINVARVVERANDRLLRTITAWGTEQVQERPHEAASIAAAMQERLGLVRASRASLRDGSAAAIIASGEHRRMAVGVPMGLAAFDMLTGGLTASEKLIIGGLYGGRKTSTAVFLATQAMRRRYRNDAETGERVEIPPEGVLFLEKDDNRNILINWFISQLATQHIRIEDAKALVTAHGLSFADAMEQTPTDEWTISARGMQAHLQSARQHQAILRAEALLSAAPLEIRDGSDGVHDFDIQLELMNDAVMNRGRTLIIDDYVQASMLKGARDVTETVNAYVQRMMPFCTAMGATYGAKLIGLSQRPEAVNAHGRAGDAAGLLGGGALARFASCIIETKGITDDPTILRMTGVKVRFGQKGLKYEYQVNPPSGLILNPGNVTPWVDPDGVR
ncbi:MAG: hypothetical protein WCG26_00975 [Chloroflexales bacterium]